MEDSMHRGRIGLMVGLMAAAAAIQGAIPARAESVFFRFPWFAPPPAVPMVAIKRSASHPVVVAVRDTKGSRCDSSLCRPDLVIGLGF
jgi:hypothetical protein